MDDLIKENEIREYFFNNLSAYGLKSGVKELTIEGLRIDIFALGKNDTPYVIEFKRGRDRYIVGQSVQYLSLVYKNKGGIQEKLNCDKINWKALRILCIARYFHERDLLSAEYAPLKGKIHFYNFELAQLNNQISIFNLKYLGPKKYGPLVIPRKIDINTDILAQRNRYYEIKNTIARRNFYNQRILSLFNELDICLKKNGNIKLFRREWNWGKFFQLFFSTNQNWPEGARITINFFNDFVYYGFFIDDETDETKDKILQNLNDKKYRKLFIDKILKLSGYYLWIDHRKITEEIAVSDLDNEKMNRILDLYINSNNTSFYIMKEYETEKMTVNDIKNIINHEYLVFKFIIEKTI